MIAVLMSQAQVRVGGEPKQLPFVLRHKAVGPAVNKLIASSPGSRLGPWAYPGSTQVLWLGGQVLWHFTASCGQVENGCGCHVRGLHVVCVVKAALATGATGAAATTTAEVAAAAGCIAAGGAAAGAGILAVPLGCRDRGQCG